MASKKIRDIVAKTGEYIDHSGKQKGRYVNAGSLFYNEDEKSYFILLNRTFNPAGVPLRGDGRDDNVLLSCFDPGRKKGGNQTSQYGGSTGSNSYSGSDYATASGGRSTYASTSHQRPIDDDDITF